MAGVKKKIELFVDINTEKELDMALNNYRNKLICAEIYCSFVDSCTALDRLFTKYKMDWGDDQVVLLKILADNIEALRRFRGHSEPVYMFIMNKRVTKVFRGVNSMGFEQVAKSELQYYRQELNGVDIDRPKYDLDEVTPDEKEWMDNEKQDREFEASEIQARRAARQAARKKHRADLMVPFLQTLNFVLFWPHATNAHPELYERWDRNSIIMIAREVLQLDEKKALDILYAGDADINEASMGALLNGSALAICFRCLDDNFTGLVRKILYEEIPPLEDNKPMRDQPPQKRAFDYYKSYSPTREQIWQQRRQEKIERRKQLIFNRARRLSEMQRLARQAIQDAIETEKAKREKNKLELLKSGNLVELEKMRSHDSDDFETGIEIPEELSDELPEESSEEEDEEEYVPPPGLLIPGFYAPPNDTAKANGLAILFPKIISDYVTPIPEHLPSFVLVMLHMNKIPKALKILSKFMDYIINLGIFKASTPYNAAHIAYTYKQFQSMETAFNLDELRLCIMISIERDIPLLELMDLSPCHVSRDTISAEDECAELFPVGYGDGYPVLEDFSEDDL